MNRRSAKGLRKAGEEVVQAVTDRLQLGGDPNDGEVPVQRRDADGIGLLGKLVQRTKPATDGYDDGNRRPGSHGNRGQGERRRQDLERFIQLMTVLHRHQGQRG